MTSTFFQLLNRKPINIREINRQVFEELKKCLPKNWEIIFKLKDNLVNKPPDNSDITKYEWIIAYFSDSSKYNLAYLFNEDLKKPLSARKYPVLPLNHYSLSISLDSEILILSEYQDNNTDTRTSKSYSLSQVKKVYICKINDKAISQLLKESMNEREQTVIKLRQKENQKK